MIETYKRGRPRLSYEDGSAKTKKRRIQELLSTYSADEIKKAAELLDTPCDTDSDIDKRQYGI